MILNSDFTPRKCISHRWLWVAVLCLVVGARLGLEARYLTFFAVCDTHYGLSPEGNRVVPALVDAMNGLPSTAYPTNFGGTAGKPRGVIQTGDITNDGKEEECQSFVNDYGLDAGGGRLRYPVYETYGNHDGGPKSPVRSGIRELNMTRDGLLNVAFRCKSGVKTNKTAIGGVTHEWPGTWEWKWLLDKPISSPARDATASR